MENEISIQAEIDAAEAIRMRKYPDAGALFLAGSIVRGEGNRYSDLDIVVVHERLPAAYRESFKFSRWPVEVFVHDPATLGYFFEQDRIRGIPSLAAMISEGIEIPEANQLSNACKEKANALLAKGPPSWNQSDVDASRYAITNLLDDIREPRSYMEAVAIGAELHNALATHVFRTRDMWSATGKMIPRRLEKTLPDIAANWQACFSSVFKTGRSDDLVLMVETLLAPNGGLLFENYTQTAPASWKQDGQN